jgi:hypothetical protein
MHDDLVECPVCDRPIDPDATSCPTCGADFTMQGIDELERVVKTLDAPEPAEEALDASPAETPSDAPDAAPPHPVEAERPEQRKGLFSRLFGRSGR